MPHKDLQTKALLTVIVVLLVLNTLAQFHAPAVHAQSTSSPYSVELVKVRWNSKQFQADLATAINDAAKGREPVTMVPYGNQARYLVVYK